MPGGYFKRVVRRRRLGRVEKKNQVKKEKEKKVRLTKVGGREKRRKTLLACLKDKRDDGRLYFSLKKKENFYLPVQQEEEEKKKEPLLISWVVILLLYVQHTHARQQQLTHLSYSSSVLDPLGPDAFSPAPSSSSFSPFVLGGVVGCVCAGHNYIFPPPPFLVFLREILITMIILTTNRETLISQISFALVILFKII